MLDTSTHGEEFIDQVEAILLDNISKEQFGVSELAEAMSMSRSNLLRKIKKHTQLSASQFIRQVRLKKGMEMLRQTSLTVSEVSYQVGFGSTSYFIKCFREYYGYPPGEAGKRGAELHTAESSPKRVRLPLRAMLLFGLIPLIVLLVWLIADRQVSSEVMEDKSIAVLPFKNESEDSSNEYFINGLMESTLNNLQRIEDLRVISRTSVEKYRNSDMTIPDIANELNVNYFVEGSGQKIGDQVVLHIQLIDASSDRHIWGEQYSRKVGDIFALQNEVATQITEAIEAIVTPAELKQIKKKPTDNLQAYDYYLQALDPYYSRTKEGLEKAIPLFEQAIGEDPEFALAYANIAISYFFLDLNQREKQYTEQINNYADKALLYDAKSTESLIAKALYYMHTHEFRLALPHLEKALEYNPNSSVAVQMLSDFYARITPNTAKYLEYALRGLQLDIAADDSVAMSYTYLHLSNALIQSGFTKQATIYIDKSLEYNPDNEFGPILKAFILYANDGDVERMHQMLLDEWKKDTTRMDILQEIAKIYYFKEDFANAYRYYKKFVDAKERQGLTIYPQEDIKIGIVFQQMGLHEEAEKFFTNYAQYCENDESIYKTASMAVKYAHEGKYEQAIEQLKAFARQDNFQYWILLFIEQDPVIKPLKNHPEFAKIVQKIEDRFWENHDRLQQSLEAKGLI
jgi:TolB-like protein/AraC-like DNA-binding protein